VSRGGDFVFEKISFGGSLSKVGMPCRKRAVQGRHRGLLESGNYNILVRRRHKKKHSL
jgi:hypothetical protein